MTTSVKRGPRSTANWKFNPHSREFCGFGDSPIGGGCEKKAVWTLDMTKDGQRNIAFYCTEHKKLEIEDGYLPFF